MSLSIKFNEDSRHISKSNRVPNGVAEYAELRKNFQIIDYVTLTTSEAFDNILGSNSFSESFLASNEDDEAELSD